MKIEVIAAVGSRPGARESIRPCCHGNKENEYALVVGKTYLHDLQDGNR